MLCLIAKRNEEAHPMQPAPGSHGQRSCAGLYRVLEAQLIDVESAVLRSGT